MFKRSRGRDVPQLKGDDGAVGDWVKEEAVIVQVEGRTAQKGRRNNGFVCLTGNRIFFKSRMTGTDDDLEDGPIHICYVGEVTQTDINANDGIGDNLTLDQASYQSNASESFNLTLLLSLDDGSTVALMFTGQNADVDRTRFQAELTLRTVEATNYKNMPQIESTADLAGFSSKSFGSGFGSLLANRDDNEDHAKSQKEHEEIDHHDGADTPNLESRERTDTTSSVVHLPLEVSRSVTTTGLHVGARVVVTDRRDGQELHGVLKYCGPVHFKLGEVCGVELDIPSGNSNGHVGRVKYFSCPKSHGIFVNVDDLSEPQKHDTVKVKHNRPNRRELLLPKPDFAVGEDCKLCRSSFTSFRRQHHCRNCGALCCDKCSSSKIEIPYRGYFSPERVCDDCMDIVPLFIDASGIEKKSKNSIGLTKNRRDQLAALDHIKETIVTPECFHLIEAGLIDLILMLASLPVEQIKSRAISIVLGLTQHTTLQEDLIKEGVLDILNSILKSETEAQPLVDTANAVCMLAENPNHRLAATRAGIVETILLHLADSNDNLNLVGSEIVATLCQDPVCQQLICTSKSGEQLYRILAFAARVTDIVCQKNILLAIAHLTTNFANARRCFNANIILCDVFRPLTIKLVAEEATLSVPEEAAKQQSLTHIACVLANLSVLGEWDVNRSMLAGTLAKLVKPLGKLSDDFLEHISRGLANVSFYPHSADVLLRCLKYLLPSFQMSRSSTRCSVLKLLNNLMMTKRSNTTDLLSRWPNFAETLEDLIATGTEDGNIVSSLAHRLHISLSDTPVRNIKLLDVEPDADNCGRYPPEASPPSTFEFSSTSRSRVSIGEGRLGLHPSQAISLRSGKSTKKSKKPEDILAIKFEALSSQRRERLKQLETLLASTEDPKMQLTIQKNMRAILQRVANIHKNMPKTKESQEQE